jgi:hypothetical protein
VGKPGLYVYALLNFEKNQFREGNIPNFNTKKLISKNPEYLREISKIVLKAA